MGEIIYESMLRNAQQYCKNNIGEQYYEMGDFVIMLSIILNKPEGEIITDILKLQK